MHYDHIDILELNRDYRKSKGACPSIVLNYVLQFVPNLPKLFLFHQEALQGAFFLNHTLT